jgi:hypothetical protein
MQINDSKADQIFECLVFIPEKLVLIEKGLLSVERQV